MRSSLSSHTFSARCSRSCAAPLRALQTCKPLYRQCRGAGTQARASGDSEAVPPVQQMSYEDALKVLGLSGPSSFDQIVNAKNKQLAASQSNQEKMMEVCCCCGVWTAGSPTRHMAHSGAAQACIFTPAAEQAAGVSYASAD